MCPSFLWHTEFIQFGSEYRAKTIAIFNYIFMMMDQNWTVYTGQLIKAHQYFQCSLSHFLSAFKDNERLNWTAFSTWALSLPRAIRCPWGTKWNQYSEAILLNGQLQWFHSQILQKGLGSYLEKLLAYLEWSQDGEFLYQFVSLQNSVRLWVKGRGRWLQALPSPWLHI